MEIKIPKYSSKKKTIIKIDSWDTWNCDTTLALVIFPMLVQLKQNKQGIPSDFTNVGGAEYDSQQSFGFYSETYNDAFELGVKRWDETLDKMIWSFYQIAYCDADEPYHHGESDFQFSEHSIIQLNPDYWYDAEGARLHSERIDEGLILFGKYFRALWD